MQQADELSPNAITALASRLDRPVVLVGLMGAGKSTVGRRLATLLRLPFFDSDAEIEKAAGRSVSDIFADFGEAHFRDGERRVIARLLQGDRAVVATGGGAFVQEDTRALILDRAIAVWLDCDIDTLVARTARRDNRPLLKAGDPREILTRLAEERGPAYAQAPLRVATGKAPHHATAMRILGAIDQWL